MLKIFKPFFCRCREDREKELEGQVMQLESDLVNAKLKLSSAQENKHNVGMYIIILFIYAQVVG